MWGMIKQFNHDDILMKFTIELHGSYDGNVPNPSHSSKFVNSKMLDYFYELSEIPGTITNFVQYNLMNKDASGAAVVDNIYGTRIWRTTNARGAFPSKTDYSNNPNQGPGNRCLSKPLIVNYCNHFAFLKSRDDMDSSRNHLNSGFYKTTPIESG